MTSIGVSVDGLDKLKADLGKVGPNTKRELQKAIGVVLLRIAAEAQTLISRGGRSGVIYKRRTITHQASAAGEAPKTDRGTLVRNITAQIDADGLGGTAGSRDAAAHGRWLELGTSRMGARPWLAPTFAKLQDYIVQRLEQGMGKAFDESMGK